MNRHADSFSPSITASTRPRAALHFAALSFFSLTAFLTLYPLLFSPGSRTAGYDWFFPHWAYWWVRHALTTEGLHVYTSNFVMAPFTTSFAYNAMALFWFPVWAALEPVVGTIAAVNVIIFLACVLNGYVFFVFLRSEAAAPGLALIGGVVLQVFPAVRYFYYNSHINLMNWFLIPALLLIWKAVAAAVRGGRLRRSAIAAGVMGVGLWAAVLSDLQYPILGAFVLGPYGLLTLWRSPQRGLLAGLGVLAVGLALGLLWLAGPLPYLDDMTGTLAPSPVEERPVIDFPAGFLAMADTWWDWNSPSFGAFVSATALISLAAALARFPRGGWDRWVWLVVFVPPLVLALGPTLTIGDVRIAMPFRLLYTLTDGHFKMPWRLGPAFALGVMAFASKVWSPRLPRHRAARAFLFGGVFLLLALDLRLFAGGPTTPVLPRYATYEQMGREPYDYVVIEVPTGAGTGEILLGDADAIPLQYYGIFHGKRMVNGFISRAPLEHFWYLHTDDPMMAWLGQRRLLEPDAVENQLRQRIFDWPVGYLVVHQDLIRRKGTPPEEVIGYLNAHDALLCAPTVEGSAVFYRTRWHPDGCIPRTPPEVEPGVYAIDIGTSGDERYIGWGWHWQETVAGITLRWAGDRPQTDVYLDLPPGSYEVAVAMQAFEEPRRVRIALNGRLLEGEATVQPDSLASYTFDLPADAVGSGTALALSLHYDGWLVPAEIGHSPDRRRLAVAVDWLRFTRRSG